MSHAPSLTEQLAEVLLQHGWMLSTAESCTGGLIAGLITSVPGSSDVFDRGFVTYTNAAGTGSRTTTFTLGGASPANQPGRLFEIIGSGGETPIRQALSAAGFVATPKGLRLRA